MNPIPAHYPSAQSLPATDAGYVVPKRIFDAVVATMLLLLFMPVMATIALVVCLDSPGGAFFAQERVGKKGVLFHLWKFRSMRRGTPNLSTADMQKQSANPVTRVGAFLRRTSLDELPQLLNVLRGQMSLVGPRPALVSQTELNEMRTSTGADVLLPGITGWAQINGRDELSDAQKVAHDVYYRHHCSLKLDLIILVRTLTSVITGRGNR